MVRRDVLPEEALAQIFDVVASLDAEQVILDDALDRVLAEPIVAPSPLPPFSNAGMDGYAVRVQDVAAADRARPVRLWVSQHLPAGAVSDAPLVAGTAVRIMTGAPLPPGAEVVVPLEESIAQDDGTVLICQALPMGRHVRPAGEDICAGMVALPAGRVIRPVEIGLLAALGYRQVAVVRRPRVAILSTGDELVPATAMLEPGKIRDCNGPALAALVRRYGGQPQLLGIARDSYAALHERLCAAIAQQADLIVTSAGASGGDYDLIRAILEAEGELFFWLVSMKPGRPLMFGMFQGTPVIGLAGNPAAALIGAELFVRPALLRMAGRAALAKPQVQASLDAPIACGPRRHYVRAWVRRAAGGYQASVSSGSHGAGSLTGLTSANALLIIPEGRRELSAGSSVDALMLDWPEVVDSGDTEST